MDTADLGEGNDRGVTCSRARLVDMHVYEEFPTKSEVKRTSAKLEPLDIFLAYVQLGLIAGTQGDSWRTPWVEKTEWPRIGE